MHTTNRLIMLTQKNVWPLNRKILIWNFWDYKSLFMVQKINSHPAPGCNRSPLLCIFKRCNSWECSVQFFRGPWPNLPYVLPARDLIRQNRLILSNVDSFCPKFYLWKLKPIEQMGVLQKQKYQNIWQFAFSLRILVTLSKDTK